MQENDVTAPSDIRKSTPSKEQMDEYWRRARECSSFEQLLQKDGPLSFLFKETIETMLKEEMTDHLGYSHNDARSKRTTNSRNGFSSKTVKADSGAVEVQVPRDREGTFTPQVLPKGKTSTSDLEKKIISMYANGMTTRDIACHVSDMYLGANVSESFISRTTEKILPLAKEWLGRGLDDVYPIVFFDAVHYKVREDGKIVTKAVYVCLGINLEGKREVLGFYVGDSESSKFWLNVFTDLSNRGVKDILIACVDGLKGLPEAIGTIFPQTEVQLCVIHQIRNSFKYVKTTDQKEFMKDLKRVYKASNESIGLQELDNLEKKWGRQYPFVIKSWRLNWDNLSKFFQYSEEIRKIIYTTNIIEGFNRQLRKVTKNRGSFPTDDSLLKLLYLATMQASKKWTMPRRGWAQIIGQLAIQFEGRLNLGF